ncbi:MAG: hypothetical protein IJ795_02185 [Bacteroidales bacterium]|nr:hypothetical protein [Bacteroidales bacterium]
MERTPSSDPSLEPSVEPSAGPVAPSDEPITPSADPGRSLEEYPVILDGRRGFDTVAEALAAASEGSAVILREGVFEGNVSVEGKSVALEGSLSLEGSPLSVLEGVITVKESRLSVRNLGFSGSGPNIVLEGSGNSVTLSGNVFGGDGQSCVLLSGVSNSELILGDGYNDDNVFEGDYQYAYKADQMPDNVVFMPILEFDRNTGELAVVTVPDDVTSPRTRDNVPVVWTRTHTSLGTTMTEMRLAWQNGKLFLSDNDRIYVINASTGAYIDDFLLRMEATDPRSGDPVNYTPHSICSDDAGNVMVAGKYPGDSKTWAAPMFIWKTRDLSSGKLEMLSEQSWDMGSNTGAGNFRVRGDVYGEGVISYIAYSNDQSNAGRMTCGIPVKGGVGDVPYSEKNNVRVYYPKPFETGIYSMGCGGCISVSATDVSKGFFAGSGGGEGFWFGYCPSSVRYDAVCYSNWEDPSLYRGLYDWTMYDSSASFSDWRMAGVSHGGLDVFEHGGKSYLAIYGARWFTYASAAYAKLTLVDVTDPSKFAYGFDHTLYAEDGELHERIDFDKDPYLSIYSGDIVVVETEGHIYAYIVDVAYDTLSCYDLTSYLM